MCQHSNQNLVCYDYEPPFQIITPEAEKIKHEILRKREAEKLKSEKEESEDCKRIIESITSVIRSQGLESFNSSFVENMYLINEKQHKYAHKVSSELNSMGFDSKVEKPYMKSDYYIITKLYIDENNDSK